MLRSANEMTGYTIHAEDGDFGSVKDFYLDDRHWKIRYMVADAGSWFSKKLVLVSTAAFLESPDPDSRIFPVNLTKQLVKSCPDIEYDLPVSRQNELEMVNYYRWPAYWTAFPQGMVETIKSGQAESESAEEQSHLRSVRELTGYHIEAKDGDIGHVADFLLDDGDWSLSFAVVKLSNWLPSEKTVIPVSLIQNISWADGKIRFDLQKEDIQKSPEYDESAPVFSNSEFSLEHLYAARKQ